MACTCGKCAECDWARHHPDEDDVLRSGPGETEDLADTLGVATQTVGISGASAAMQAGGMPRRDQHLPDATSPELLAEIAMLRASESQLARMAGEYKRLYHEICGPMLTRCRAAQDAEHGGPAHDDTHTPAEWAEFIRKFAGRAEYQGQFQDNAEAIARYQKCMIDVAGLAISAVLSSQRKVCGESA